MKLECKSIGCYCELDVFTINGQDAIYEDFGSKYDHYKDGAGDYCCGDMRFEANPPTDEVLSKYGITKREYKTVCKRLTEELNFGRCGECI